MGLITEMFLTFDGFDKPNVGDHLRISCMFKGVVRDIYTVLISKVCDCIDEPGTVLIKVGKIEASDFKGEFEPEQQNYNIEPMANLRVYH